MTERDDKFCDWLIEGEDKPEVDAVLHKIYSSCADGSRSDAEKGFARFAQSAGLTPPPRRMAKVGNWALRAAAVLILPVIGLCVWSLSRTFSAESEWLQVATSYAETSRVTLPDGSTALLSPCSQLFYPEEFKGRQRKVILVGEAFMDVTKDKRRQFVVSTGNMSVIVHGTKFNVSSFPDNEEDEVALVEGSVEMSFPEKESSVFLSPGDLVKYDRNTGTVQRRTFAANYFEEVVSLGGLQFRNTPLSDIASTLDRKYNVNIVIQDQDLASERYYASFINQEDVKTILEALNTGNHFLISQKDSIFYITKK